MCHAILGRQFTHNIMSGAGVKAGDNVHAATVYGDDNAGYVVRNELSDMLSFAIESIEFNRQIIQRLQHLQANNLYCRCDYFDVVHELSTIKLPKK